LVQSDPQIGSTDQPAANTPVFIHDEQGKPSQMPAEVAEPLA
jgi:hypothetical protein